LHQEPSNDTVMLNELAVVLGETKETLKPLRVWGFGDASIAWILLGSTSTPSFSSI
jgi:hypothetical protein